MVHSYCRHRCAFKKKKKKKVLTWSQTALHKVCDQACDSAEAACAAFLPGKLFQTGLGVSLGQNTVMTNSGPGGGNVGDKSCCCFWFMSLWGLKQSQKEIVDTGAAFNAKNFKNHGHCTVQSISGSKHNISLLQQIAENDRVLVAIRHSAGIK